MCSLVSRKHPDNNNKLEDDDRHEELENPAIGYVTSQLYLKPTGGHTTGTLDKAVVLRRIHHRKRVNKVKSALQALLGSPIASVNADDNNKTCSVNPQLRWVDDAYAAP
ncbi:hypothetical protein PHJA_001443100 [Phtheirospermum japonicum]|uniref:Uncharacterized protein n=1 Tax=Phtheirospermum japonicum TaxID=374723 RepID=A0A830C7J6_9LAMI|nr:hypothetical protein PHJA_001443100 [Phtheirospermum japonicum]